MARGALSTLHGYSKPLDPFKLGRRVCARGAYRSHPLKRPRFYRGGIWSCGNGSKVSISSGSPVWTGRKERPGALSFHVKSSFTVSKATIWRGVIIGSVTGTQNTTSHHEAW